jgi:hypothetical protein
VFMPAIWCISCCKSIFCTQFLPHSFTLTITNRILDKTGTNKAGFS